MKLVFTPSWFLGKDVLIEGFSFIVLFCFSLLCLKNYKLNKNKKFLYLGAGFGLIALAQIAIIFTKLVLYYDTTFTQTVGQMVVTYQIVEKVDVFYYLGFFFHRVFTLLGLYVIYRLSVKKKYFEDLFLGLYFVVISAVFSINAYYYIFHVTALILLILITKNYYEVYKENKFINTKILILAFSMLALSQMLFTLSKLSFVYVTGNVIELISYIILLVLIIRILKH